MTIIIHPCMLGFDVRVVENHHERTLGIYVNFTDVIRLLFNNWKLDFQVEVK